MIRSTLISLFVLLLVHMCQSQDPSYSIIGKEELSSLDIYSILWEDDQDLLYLSTNDGVLVRRQNQFVKLVGKKGHVGASYFNLQQQNGQVYCSNLNGQIFRVNELKLELFFEVIEDEFWTNFDYVVFPEEVIVFSNRRIWRVDMSGQSELILDDNQIKEMGLDPMHFSMVGGTKIEENGVAFSIQGSSDYIYYNSKEKRLTWCSASIPEVTKHERYRHVSICGELLFIDINGELHTGSDSLISMVKPRVNERYLPLRNGDLLCMDSKNGARIITIEKDTVEVIRTFFNHLFVSAATESEDGTLYLGTFGEGVIIIPNFNTSYTASEELFLGIDVSPDDEVFISTRSGKVLSLKDTLNTLDQRPANVDRVFYFKAENDYHTASNHLLYDLFLPEVPSIKDAYQINDSLILVGFRNSIGLVYYSELPKTNFETYITNDEDTIYHELWQTKRVHAVGYYNLTDQVIFSTSFGVEVVDWKSKQPSELFFEGKEILCSDILEYKDKLLLATFDRGILMSNLKETNEFLSEKNGLLSNDIRNIELSNEWLFILSDKGLQVYDMNKQKFIPLNFKEGLVDEILKNFAISDDKLWVLYKHGVSSINLKDLGKTASEISLSIDSVMVSGYKLGISNNVFRADQNYLKAFIDYRDIITSNEVKISYQLKGWSDAWLEISSTENLIEFKSLPPGDYSFKVKAAYRGKEYVGEAYEFIIDFPYYQKWWFYLLISISGSLIIALIARQRIREIKKRDEVKIKMLENESKALMAQLKAIRAQMNPHFIFNSITSIQDLILKDEKLKSYDYLEEFSKMVRTTLEMSDKEFVSIGKEVQYLDVYLKLEQLRFKDDFEFQINLNASEEIKIPTLFLQPLVENALKHGLRHQIGAKRLLISFTEKDHKLVVEIEDNGIGRQASQELNKQEKKYASFSTDAIHNRIRILNNQFGVNIEMQYTDLEKGTKVTVIFPINYNQKS